MNSAGARARGGRTQTHRPRRRCQTGGDSIASRLAGWEIAGVRLRSDSPERATARILALILMIAVFTAVQPDTFATFDNFKNIFNDMAISAIIAAGLTVPLVGGDFDLSIGYVCELQRPSGRRPAQQQPMADSSGDCRCRRDRRFHRRRERHDRLEDRRQRVHRDAWHGNGGGRAQLRLFSGAAFRCSSSTCFRSPNIAHRPNVGHVPQPHHRHGGGACSAVAAPEPDRAGPAHQGDRGQRGKRASRRHCGRSQPHRRLRDRRRLRRDRRRPDGGSAISARAR